MQHPVRSVLIAIAVSITGIAAAAASAAPPAEGPVFSETTAVLGYEDASDAADALALVEDLGGAVIGHSPRLRFVVVATDDPAAFVAAAAGRDGVRYAERDPLIFPEQDVPALPAVNPVDQHYGQQWGMPAIRGPEAWTQSRGAGAVVAVLDTGGEWQHPDLAAATWVNVGEVPGNRADDDGNGYVDDVYGWNFNGNNNDPRPGSCGQHGTHVAGIVAATQNNVIGVTGVAPLAQVMHLRVLCGGNHLSAAALAVGYAAENGADVVTCSWYARYTLTAFEDAVRDAYENHDVLFVKSAGNQYGGGVTYPGTLPEYIAVSSVTSSLALSGFSSKGTKVELAAPGSGVISTYGTTMYQSLSGTSMAAPHVAGTAALVIAKNPDLTNVEVRAILGATAKDLGAAGRDTSFGFGLVDAAAAVGAA